MAAINWLAFTERLVGIDHPSLTDTVNRALREIVEQSGYDPDADPFPGLMGPVFNVKAFGATGDGTTDDTTAIQAAITACVTAGGGIVYFPLGTYLCDGELVIANKNVTLKGACRRDTKLKYTGSGDFLTLGEDDGDHAGVADAYDGIVSFTVIEDLGFEGPGSGTTARGIIDWESGLNTYRRLQINAFGTGYFGIGADICEWNDIYMTGCGTGWHFASRCDQQRLFNPYVAECGIGILSEYSFGGLVSGGQFVFNTTADVVFDAPASATEGGDIRADLGWTFNGVWFESNATPQLSRHIWLGRNGTSARILQGLAVKDCLLLSSNTLYFIEIDAGSSVVVDNLMQAGASITAVVRNNAVSGVFPNVTVREGRLIGTALSGQTSTMQVVDRLRSTSSNAFAASFTPAGNGSEIIEINALTDNITINAPTNPIRGKHLRFRFIQDGTGGRTVTWNAVFKQAWSDTGNTAGLRSTIEFYFDGTNWTQLGGQSPYC